MHFCKKKRGVKTSFLVWRKLLICNISLHWFLMIVGDLPKCKSNAKVAANEKAKAKIHIHRPWSCSAHNFRNCEYKK